ncbi:MAG TPA: hypothetical protein VKL40_09295 [Candidatus Angelobacter sp.]|nr:hypothetical protein [Candidatus Angelobacter sp.]
MKSFWKLVVITGLLSLSAASQSAGGSASGNATVKPGQASAEANVNQSVQAPGASANVNASAQTSAGQNAQNGKQQSGSQTTAGASSNTAGSAAVSGVNSSAVLSSGTTLQAELTKPLDARKARPGDEVTAKVTHDVKADGNVVVRKGSQLFGHVTEAQVRSKDHADSRLGIVFDKAVLKGGQEMSFTGTVQALAPPAQAAATGVEESAMLSSAPSAGGSSRSGSGGLVGGVTSTATGAVSGATPTVTGAATSGVNGTLSTAGGVAGGLTAQGNLTTASRGAIGLPGLTLNSATQGSAQASVVSSTSHNVKLESGTQMLLQVSGASH